MIVKKNIENTEDRQNKIRSLLDHPGWAFVEEYLDREIHRHGSLRSIKIGERADSDVVRELIARQVRGDAFQNLKLFLKNIAKKETK